MSSIGSMLLRLGDFTRIPLLSARMTQLGAHGLFTVPSLIFLLHSMNYYADFLKSQTMEFYDSSHIEVYDFIVVGGGSSGAVVANHLSRTSSVLLLELGGDPHPLSYLPIASGILQRASVTDLMYQTVPQKHSCNALKNKVMFWPRGTGIGGSSNLNFMIYQRGNPRDYDNWANITKNPIWSYQSVLKFFKKLEDYGGAYPNSKYHGTGGNMKVEKVRQTYMEEYFLKAAREKGLPVHDTNRLQGEGFGEIDVTHHKGLRWSTYPGYIEPILSRKQLTIHRYSRVIKIHLDKAKHAYGLTYNRHGITKFVRARREIILSAGAVDSPKILMLSGIGPRKHLHSVGIPCRINLPTGMNLQDHLYSFVGPFLFNENVTGSLVPTRDANLDSFIKFTQNLTGPISSISTISGVGFKSTPQNQIQSWPNIQYFLGAFGWAPGFAQGMETIMNLKPELMEEYINSTYGRDSNLIIQVLVRPKSIGFIKLASRNPYAKPLIEPNYFTHSDDLKAMIEGAKWMINMYENTSTYQGIGAKFITTPFPLCKNFEPRSDEYFACFYKAITLTLYHPVGTASMGRDDYYQKYNRINRITNTTTTSKISRRYQKKTNFTSSTSQSSRLMGPKPVVDSQLRVFKASGLRVIDASVMPVIVNANTNIPSIMIGEVGSYMLRQYWTQQFQICPNNWMSFIRKLDHSQCSYSKIF